MEKGVVWCPRRSSPCSTVPTTAGKYRDDTVGHTLGCEGSWVTCRSFVQLSFILPSRTITLWALSPAKEDTVSFRPKNKTLYLFTVNKSSDQSTNATKLLPLWRQECDLCYLYLLMYHQRWSPYVDDTSTQSPTQKGCRCRRVHLPSPPLVGVSPGLLAAFALTEQTKTLPVVGGTTQSRLRPCHESNFTASLWIKLH